MRYFASLLAIASLSAATLSASASPLGLLGDGYTIAVDNQVLSSTTAGLSIDSLTGALTFQSGLSTITIAEIDAAPLASALSVTRTCVSVNVLASCSGTTVSVSDASFLNGLLQGSLSAGVSLQAGATAGVTNLVFAQTGVGLGAQTALVGYPAANGGSSPVPEPGTLGLLGTGVLGAAGAIRRRFVA